MAITVKLPTGLPAKLANKEVDWNSDAIAMYLYTAFVFDQDADVYLADVGTKTEAANSGGYTTGGLAITTPTIEQVDASNLTRFKAAPFDWGATTTIAGVTFAVLVDKQSGADATNVILAVYDLGGAQSSSGTPFKLTQGTDGWFKSVTVDA